MGEIQDLIEATDAGEVRWGRAGQFDGWVGLQGCTTWKLRRSFWMGWRLKRERHRGPSGVEMVDAASHELQGVADAIDRQYERELVELRQVFADLKARGVDIPRGCL